MFPGIKTLIRIETTVFLGFLSINLIIRLLLSNTWVGKFLFEILFIALYYRIESFGFCLTSKHSSDLRSIFDSSSNFFTKMGFFSRTRTHRFHSIYKLFTEWSNQRMLFFSGRRCCCCCWTTHRVDSIEHLKWRQFNWITANLCTDNEINVNTEHEFRVFTSLMSTSVISAISSESYKMWLKSHPVLQFDCNVIILL